VQASLCGEVGAHGATHTALSTLSPADLDAELHGSRDFLADLCGREITSMSAPGGAVNGRVVRAALRAGFKTVAGSRPGPTRSAAPLKRMCVMSHHTPEDLLRIVQAGRLHWARQEARMAVTGSAFRLLGEARYERIRMGLGGKPRPVRAQDVSA
jgi:peptidoglycan/xylan/chitin deacetylase (PgdA/CDA1 family)